MHCLRHRDVIWMNKTYAVWLVNHFREIADVFPPLRIHQYWTSERELHKSKVHLITSTMLVVKAKNIYRNTTKSAKNENRIQPLNSIWKNSVLVQWFNQRCYMDEHDVCSVISEPFQSSSRCTSSFKDSSALLNIWEVSFICFYGFVHFGCISIYILGFHYKQCASDNKDFTFGLHFSIIWCWIYTGWIIF